MDYLRSAIKFLLFFAVSIVIYCLWLTGSLVIPNEQYWRQIVFRNWARYFVWLSGMKIELIGEKPRPPFFLVSNHLSYADIPLLRAVLDCVFVAKGEIKDWFLAGRMVSDMANIFVNRTNRRDIPRAGSEIIKALERGEGVVVFPEGTSSKGEHVLPFNSSFFEFAAKSDLPVHYASISYRIDDKTQNASDYVCWWDETPFVTHILRLFRLNSYTAIISFGCEPVVKPDRKLIARELWEKVNEKFIPVI